MYNTVVDRAGRTAARLEEPTDRGDRTSVERAGDRYMDPTMADRAPSGVPNVESPGIGLGDRGLDALPHAAEFAEELMPLLAPDAILLTAVRDDEYGVVDVVVAGADGTIGFAFRSGNSSLETPAFLDALYEAKPIDVAFGASDIIYVAVREHSNLFTSEARFTLTPRCSSRVLAYRGRGRSTVSARGEDGESFAIRIRRSRAGDRTERPGTQRAGASRAKGEGHKGRDAMVVPD